MCALDTARAEFMTRFTYKIVPAPARGLKGGGAKGPEGRFAHGLEAAINEWAAQGWEYLRAEILPSEERRGLTGTRTVQRGVLVFRRPAEAAGANPAAATVESVREARATPPLTARRADPARTTEADDREATPSPSLEPVTHPEEPPLLRR